MCSFYVSFYIYLDFFALIKITHIAHIVNNYESNKKGILIMPKKNVSQEVKERIQEMKEKKNKELAEITTKKAEAQAQKEDAEKALQKATEVTDIKAYEKAKKELHSAQTAIEMYNGRFEQISNQEYISEAESDRVIDELLSYEQELGADFVADLKEPLNQLREILSRYFADIREVEQTIRSWEVNIHANYSTRGQTIRTLPNGETTDRMDAPIPVHRQFYTGCTEAHQLEEYLKKAPFKQI